MDRLFARDPSSGEPDAPQCELLDDFAIGVQLLMGSTALASLLIKRHREHPRRAMNVWLCDASKQAFGASMVHALNVLVSLVAGANPESPSQNPCVFYFLNVGIDTTVGVYVLFLWLRAVHTAVRWCGVASADLQSGYYGDPPRFTAWVKQTMLFSLCLFLMKVCVAVTIAMVPFLETIGRIALAPFPDTRSEVVFVMLVFPLIMNVVQFWLVDHVIKHRGPAPADGNDDDLFLDGRASEDSLFTDAGLSDASLLTSIDPLASRSPPTSPRTTVASLFAGRGAASKKSRARRNGNYVSLDTTPSLESGRGSGGGGGSGGGSNVALLGSRSTSLFTESDTLGIGLPPLPPSPAQSPVVRSGSAGVSSPLRADAAVLRDDAGAQYRPSESLSLL
ncbi:hypothetical protein GGF31_005675 [Allomyces arbusculus]|nr:hypothetical protein GGF31_005675 [Allomyces arbusculus]